MEVIELRIETASIIKNTRLEGLWIHYSGKLLARHLDRLPQEVKNDLIFLGSSFYVQAGVGIPSFYTGVNISTEI